MMKVTLSNLCDIRIGRTPSRRVSEYWGKGYKWVSISDMKEEVITTTKEEITEKAITSIRCRKIPKGSLLLSFKLSVGKLAFAGTDLYTNEAIAALIVKDHTILDSKYLYYALKIIKFVGGNQAAKGITLNSKSLAELRIPLPPLDDQIRIATVLTRAEALIAKRKESINMLDELLKSTFLEMFGPKSKDFNLWPVVEIRELAEKRKGSMRTGPFGSNLLHSEFTENGDVIVLGIDNAVQNKFSLGKRRYITMEKYSKLSSYRIFPGDVIITIMGTIGRSAVIPDDIPLAINTKHLAAITFDRQLANPQFISYSIHSSPYIIKQFANKNRGAIMNGLNLGIIKETKLHKPPIELQNQFATIFEKVEVLKAKYNQSLTELENLYSSLSQRAFKEELELSKNPVDYYTGTKIGEIKMTERNDVEVKTKLKFIYNDLVELIEKKSGKVFSFDELWEEIKTLKDKKIPSRNDIQTQMIELLESDKANLQQVFDVLTSQVDKNDNEKQIAFKR